MSACLLTYTVQGQLHDRPEYTKPRIAFKDLPCGSHQLMEQNAEPLQSQFLRHATLSMSTDSALSNNLN
jgi:hypothetical protein